MLIARSRASGQTTVTLRVLSPAGSGEARRYELSDADTGRTWQETGEHLGEAGVAIELGQPETSSLLFYKAI